MTIPTYLAYEKSAEANRQAFGQMLRSWRIQCRWTQYTYCNWATASGNAGSAISYGNLSVIEQGKAGELRHKPFWQLAEQNARIHARDWGDPLLIKDRELREQLDAAIPLGDEECLVWGPLEFWACYNGLRPVPFAFRKQPGRIITPRQAKELSSGLRAAYLKLSSNGDPLELLMRVQQQAPGHCRDMLTRVLIGAAAYTPDQLATLWDDDAKDYLPQQWLSAAAGATIEPICA